MARSWIPKPKARLIPITLALGLIFWGLLYISSPGPPPDHFPDEDFPPRRYPPPPRPHDRRPSPLPPTVWGARSEQVRLAFLHAYRGYNEYAASHDELLPLSKTWTDNFNGWGLTLIDSLDTMWIMGLYDEFYNTLPMVANMNFATSKKFVPFFETVIRYLGGLLSAYALSKEPILLARADDLGKALLPAFNTTSGMPMFAVNTATGETRPGWAGASVLWSEALSCQVEYKYLARLTGRTQYYEKVDNIMSIMRDANITDGMFPTKWSIKSAIPVNGQFSVGAFADSAHEYLLKQWLLSGRTETKAKDLYLRTVDGILKHLLYLTPERNLLYVTDVDGKYVSRIFEHLSCFLPGLLALGAATLSLAEDEKRLHEWAAQGLAYTCWVTYADHATGLGPDEMVMAAWPTDPHLGRWLPHVEEWIAEGSPGGVPPGLKEVEPKPAGERDYHKRRDGYLLRPEAVESFYYLWRTTGDVRWRERGWAVFQAIERETKTESGYASLASVETSPAGKKNEMPSFFMAETLKYLYLLFREDELIPLDRWVFNPSEKRRSSLAPGCALVRAMRCEQAWCARKVVRAFEQASSSHQHRLMNSFPV